MVYTFVVFCFDRAVGLRDLTMTSPLGGRPSAPAPLTSPLGATLARASSFRLYLCICWLCWCFVCSVHGRVCVLCVCVSVVVVEFVFFMKFAGAYQRDPTAQQPCCFTLVCLTPGFWGRPELVDCWGLDGPNLTNRGLSAGPKTMY